MGMQVITLDTDRRENNKLSSGTDLQDESVLENKNTKYRKVFTIVLSGNIAMMAFTAFGNTALAHPLEDSDGIISEKNIYNNTKLNYSYNPTFSDNLQKEELYPTNNKSDIPLIVKNYVNSRTFTEVLKINIDDNKRVFLSSGDSDDLTGIIGYNEVNTEVNTGKGAGEMMKGENIEKNISFTYKVTTISLATLATISLSSIAGLNFIPSPIDSTLFITSAAGALGFIIDNFKRDKDDGRYKTT